ncbi:hypothetical protein EVJ58_g8679 [Rhodofomes roseus]|uniref:Uncharacterized protein n=1 Tax=Rhodofomes roseus TaxID=34475 RepID=A0A4Y9Y033_9APHY|nr:hypothetical protein EVJ58_g8679 [Rhodofomes roseus]
MAHKIMHTSGPCTSNLNTASTSKRQSTARTGHEHKQYPLIARNNNRFTDLSSHRLHSGETNRLSPPFLKLDHHVTPRTANHG